MIRTQESTGKTVDEAFAKACALLGVQAEDENVSREVLEYPQKTGFLGLKTTPAKVRVSVELPDAPAAAPAKPVEVVAEQPVETAAPVQETAPAAEEVPAAVAEPAAPAAEQASAAQQSAEAAEEAEEVEVPIVIEENAKVKAAVDYLREVITLMGVENVTFSAVQKGEATIIRLDGEKLGALIGRRGETMESLSYLASLVANRLEGDYIKLGLDVAGYRDKRESDLTALAQRIGAKVRKTGRSFAMEPMNPYERRIIHSAISKMEGVRSESKGVRAVTAAWSSTPPHRMLRPRIPTASAVAVAATGMAVVPAATAMAVIAVSAAARTATATAATAATAAVHLAARVRPACRSAPTPPATPRVQHPWHPSAPSAWTTLQISALARSSCDRQVSIKPCSAPHFHRKCGALFLPAHRRDNLECAPLRSAHLQRKEYL